MTPEEYFEQQHRLQIVYEAFKIGLQGCKGLEADARDVFVGGVEVWKIEFWGGEPDEEGRSTFTLGIKPWGQTVRVKLHRTRRPTREWVVFSIERDLAWILNDVKALLQ